MRAVNYLSAVTLAIASLNLVAAPIEPGADAKPTKFNVSQQTQVPGMILQPGAYSIRVMDRLQDRLIMRIDGASSGTHSTFIGLPNSDMPKSSAGIIAFGSSADGTAARGFSFPSGKTVEFVYPKAEAVSLAKANGAEVVAIDPASEGRVATDKGLSKSDMEIVTLWTLSSTKVGPGDADPAIKAAKYKAAPATGNDQVASVTPTPKPKPVIARLPHTGSSLPLLGLLGMFSLVAAAGLRIAAISKR